MQLMVKLYKTIDGKSENKFAFNGNYKNKDFAMKIIKENHVAWIENYGIFI